MISIAKFLLRIILRILYKVDVKGMEHYHSTGKRVLIVANHTSLLDGLLLYAWLPETPTFAINTQIAEQPRFRFFLKFVELFRMDPTNPLSVKSMIKFIQQDRKAVIFPEGRITTTGTLMKIYDGPGLIADKSQADILPIAINGAQYSPLSYMKDRGHIRLFPKITITVLPPEKIKIDAGLSGKQRRQHAALAMQDIMNKLIFYSVEQNISLFKAYLNAIKRYGKKHIIAEDINRQAMSYQQILLKIFVLARKLSNFTKRGEYTGILLPNTLALPVTFFALSYLGRIPAMLNYTAGIQNIQRALETAEIKTIFTARAFIEKAGLQDVAEALEQQYQVVYLEDLRDQISLADKLTGLFQSLFPHSHYKRVNPDQDADIPAVVLFTSGSEGTPKGVVLSHKNLLSNHAQILCNIDFAPSDIVFSCLPMFHCFGLNAGLIAPLLSGTKIFIYPTPLHYRLIPEVFYEIQATILFGTNTFLQGYARYAHPYDFHSARYVVAGAEKLRDDTVHLWMDKYGKRIYQGYGVTETSPVISVNNAMYYRQGSVGRPVPELECRLQKVEGIEQGGRLCIRAPNVMLGYLLHDQPGKIQFPECPLGKGWYDTGDIADIDDDGFIHILGRAKRFAKLGGEMVSLTLVEEIASQVWPDYAHAAVNLPDDRKGEKIILISEFGEANRRPFQEHVRQHGHSELTIPKNILFTKEFPVLGTGKTDYTTLTKLAEQADANGKSWLEIFTSMMVPSKPDNPPLSEAPSHDAEPDNADK